jgi:tetratricopeptide (TPR) repeat protein
MRCRCAALLVLVPSLASAGNALDKPAFTASPAELLAEAKKAPPSDSGAVILRQDDELSLDDKDLGVHRTRYVAVITSRDAEEDWEGIWREWRPWQQHSPVIRARVISPNGHATNVDTSKLVDEPNRSGQLRHISVQLPPLDVGCVIEEEVTQADSVPYPGGRSMSVPFYGAYPTLSARIAMSAPKALKAHTFTHVLAAGRHTVAGGRDLWTFTFDHLPAVSYDSQMPEDQVAVPEVGIVTATWASAAKAYAAALAPSLVLPQPAELPHGDTREVGTAVLAWLHGHVRYIGERLLESPLDGVRLDAVVQRGTANTNELGALAVTLLRGAGIAADLVLVDRGPAFGSNKDYVSIGSFDHVLVRAHIAGREVWLDPEEPDLPLGQLRAEDQGRRALSIADAALIHTPAANAADNTVREVRTYEIPELGNAKVTEVSHEGGAFQPDQRSWVRDTSLADQRKSLTEYTDRIYGGPLDGYTTTPVDDLAHPLEMTLTVQHAKRALSHWSKAEIWLYPSDALARIDRALRDTDAAPRTHDLAILLPHIYEIENRIVLPDGFTIPKPAPDRTLEVGAYRIAEHQHVEGQALVVTYRLSAEKSRLTPAEVTATIHAVHDLGNDGEHISFDQTGWSLIDSGDLKKGIAELQRLVAARPRDALRRARYAQGLLDSGDGEGARREARKAVEIDPKSATAYAVLGFVLTHDLMGRSFAKGYDRAGARAAYEKARALNPQHYGAALELAELLERDQRGWRFEAGVDMRAAASAWRAVVELDPSDAHRTSLARALMWAGDAAGAEAILQKLPESADRNSMLVAAVAMTQGADAAQRAGDATALRGGTSALLLLRQYDLARKLAAAGGAATGTPASFYEKLRRDDTPFRPTADPKDVALQLMLEQLDPDRTIDVAWDKDVADDMRADAVASAPKHVDGFTLATYADILRANASISVEGDSAGWRVEVTGFNAGKGAVYLASDAKGPKVIGSPLHLRGLGRQVLRLAGTNDDAAGRLLDWAAKEGREPRLQALWGANLPRTTAAIRLAGALLAEDPAKSLPIAQKCLVTTTMAQLACDTVIVDAYTKQQRWADLEAFASTTWAARGPKQFPVVELTEANALTHLGRFDDAKQVYDDVLAKFPDNHDAMYVRAILALHEGKRDEAVQRLSALAQRSDTTPQEVNEITWLKVTSNLDIPNGVELVKHAAQLESKSHAMINTLAGVEAETGDLHAALADVRKAVDLGATGEPSDADWYVLGRILEQAGLRDDAIRAYRRVHKAQPDVFATDTYTLATRRLKALGAKR